DVAIKTDGGTSAPIKLHVDDLPQQEENEPNNTVTAAHEVSLPASAWGVIADKGDADHIAFTARKGQTIVLDLAATSLGSKLNAVVAVLDDAGRPMVLRNDFDGQADPLLAFSPPA